MTKKRGYTERQAISPLAFKIPKDHLPAYVSITQDDGHSVDKDAAYKILVKRPYVAKVINTLKYRGTTTKYHVFSYPEPKSL